MSDLPIQCTNTDPASVCWFCARPAVGTCTCKRQCCAAHAIEGRCMLCGVAYGLYEEGGRSEYVGELILYSLAAQTGDPYIVVPLTIQGTKRLPLPGVERLVGGLVQVTTAQEPELQHRAACVLAQTISSWSSMDPSQVPRQNYGIGLICANQVRHALLTLVKESRGKMGEQTTIMILDKLRTADFRQLYPTLVDNFQMLRCTKPSTAVQETIQAIGDLYPTRSYAINERCELLVYEQYMNRKRGAGDILERMYGLKLRYAQPLARLLKKGAWQADFSRFQKWYPGEDEPI